MSFLGPQGSPIPLDFATVPLTGMPSLSYSTLEPALNLGPAPAWSSMGTLAEAVPPKLGAPGISLLSCGCGKVLPLGMSMSPAHVLKLSECICLWAPLLCIKSSMYGYISVWQWADHPCQVKWLCSHLEVPMRSRGPICRNTANHWPHSG